MPDFQHSVLINAPQERVWDILIDVEKWREWDKDVKSALLHGPFKEGVQGTLISVDGLPATFFITKIVEPHYYSNYYQYPFFTRLAFTHKLEPQAKGCKVTFEGSFVGPLAWYYLWKQGCGIRSVMKRAMTNLAYQLSSK